MYYIFLLLSWGFFAISIIFYKNRRKIAGKAGEFWTKKELKKLNNEYRVINDIMIKTEDGKTHQIDHIVISKYGIFVIETKHLNACIIGDDYVDNWTYKLLKKTYYIKNPIHQNYGHIQTLKKILNLDENLFISIVCITSRAKIKVNSNKVVGVNKLLVKIKSYNIKKIDNEEEIYNKIKSINIIDKKERKQHNRITKELKEQKEIDNKNKCPLCGAYLVGRTGKNGPFTGCSNYPKCKYTRN